MAIGTRYRSNKAKELTLGRRLAEIRKSRGMTLQQVGDAVGCTRSMISAIERNRANPSISLLRTIAQALGVSMATLFEDPADTAAAKAPKPVTAASWKDVPLPLRQRVVRTSERRPAQFLDEKVVFELLSPSSDCAIELFRAVLAAGSSTGSGLLSHSGEEFVYVLQGRLRCYVGDEVHHIGPGDVLYYNSELPHRWENPYEQPAEVLSGVTPPEF